ncbi:hypothetical protein CYMTET_30115 [Cymbomonas tetramitiformis]|uniref:Uncharacterized protein n=1 Tax=Cymbomonas tetramitiformis TaxID=36881 RepID=A0AAE0FK41_9CHLO|nr:hypothetical protein CYMTET_30115 [Cymbomonas tetramitiformis]
MAERSGIVDCSVALGASVEETVEVCRAEGEVVEREEVNKGAEMGTSGEEAGEEVATQEWEEGWGFPMCSTLERKNSKEKGARSLKRLGLARTNLTEEGAWQTKRLGKAMKIRTEEGALSPMR